MLHPNLHPPLVHFPIALLFTGLVIEIFSFLGWRQHPIRSAGRWMILLGHARQRRVIDQRNLRAESSRSPWHRIESIAGQLA